MSFLSGLFNKAERAINSYTGDKDFLAAAAAAAANVTAADGTIEDSEMDAAISSMQANKTISRSYTGSQIEEALQHALTRAKTRSGRMENKRAIEAVMTREIDARQDIFLVAADVGDANSHSGIGADERRVLEDIAKALNVDAKVLLS